MEYSNLPAASVTKEDKIWGYRTKSLAEIQEITKNRSAKTVTFKTSVEKFTVENVDKLTVIRKWDDEKKAIEQLSNQN